MTVEELHARLEADRTRLVQELQEAQQRAAQLQAQLLRTEGALEALALLAPAEQDEQ